MTENFVGKPDGLTEDLSNFLEIGREICFKFESLEPRAIVGTKGSGKSFTLRKFSDGSRAAPDRYVMPIDQESPDLDSLIKFSTSIPAGSRTNTWQKVWEHSILVSVSTHFLFSDEIENLFPSVSRTRWRDALKPYEKFLLGLQSPTSVYDALRRIIEEYRTYSDFLSMSKGAGCINYYNAIEKLLDNCPIICVHLDCLDEELRRAPSIIVDITRALFYFCIKQTRSVSKRSKIHVTTTIRDIVYRTIMSSEHADRYRDTPHILNIPWSPPLIETFFEKKIEFGLNKFPALRESNLTRGTSIEAFFGYLDVQNTSKKCTESIERYVVRHTNCSPRTIVSLTNRLFDHKYNKGNVDHDSLKEMVNSISEEQADTLIKVSSAYIVSCIQGLDVAFLLDTQKDMNESKFRKIIMDGSNFNEKSVDQIMASPMVSLTDGFINPIKAFIRQIGKDVFTKDCLFDALSEFTKKYSDYRDQSPEHQFGRLENVLWAQGLIGVRRTQKSIIEDECNYPPPAGSCGDSTEDGMERLISGDARGVDG